MAGDDFQGILTAAAVIAAGAVVIWGTDTFKDPDEKNYADLIKNISSNGKLTDESAKARALAMADYAEKYFKAVNRNAKANMIIALIQQAAAFYFADKEHDVKKQAQNRLDEVWKDQKDKSDKLFSEWYDKARPIANAMLDEARAREQQGYTVQYDTAILRAKNTAEKEYGLALQKLTREQYIHCTGNYIANARSLLGAKIRAITEATNKAIRFEEDRKWQKEKELRDEVKYWINAHQQLLSPASNAISVASQSATSYASINPYDGWTSAVSSLSNLSGLWGVGNMTNFQMNNTGIPAILGTF